MARSPRESPRSSAMFPYMVSGDEAAPEEEVPPEHKVDGSSGESAGEAGPDTAAAAEPAAGGANNTDKPTPVPNSNRPQSEQDTVDSKAKGKGTTQITEHRKERIKEVRIKEMRKESREEEVREEIVTVELKRSPGDDVQQPSELWTTV